MMAQRTVYQSWKHFLIDQPKDFFRSVLSLLRDRPQFLLLLAICLLHFNWWSIPIILIGLIFHQFLNECFTRLALIRTQRKLIVGFLEIYGRFADQGLVVKKYLLSDYLSADEYQEIDTFLSRNFTHFFGLSELSINDSILVYQLNAPGILAANVTCYWIPIKTYIFFNCAPGKNKGAFQRFCLLHELGHACLSFTGVVFYATHGLKVSIVYLIFLYFQLSGAPWIIWAAPVLLILLVLWEKFYIWVTRKVNDEIFADDFAISYLKETEVTELKSLIIKYKWLFADQELNEAENEIRLRELVSHLELSSTQKQEQAMIKTYSRLYKTPFFLLIVACIVASLPAIYSHPVGAGFFLVMLACAFVSGLTLLFLTFIWLAADKSISSYLENWRQADQ